MDRQRIAGIVDSNMSVSDKIRALNAEGCPRADIARALGKRYQHVRNVLEADRVAAGAATDRGVAEPTRPYRAAPATPDVQERGSGGYRLAVREDGSVVLPPAVREAFGLAAPGAVVARLEGDEFRLYSAETGLRRARALLAPHMRDGESWADDLIADRRADQAREDLDA